MTRHTSPARVVREIAWQAGQEPASNFAGLHFFTFGATERTAEWAKAVAGGAIALTSDAGFDPLL